MIHLIGGAPRTGKTVLGQEVARELQIGWISTDVLLDVLRAKQVEGKRDWNADPAAISAAAEWFYPFLERFVFGVNSLADAYVVEGVDFLPVHVSRLSALYEVQAVFLGHSAMTPENFDRFPGRSPGYASLPKDVRRRMAQDVPRWSEFVREAAERDRHPYIDMSGDFPVRLREARHVLMP